MNLVWELQLSLVCTVIFVNSLNYFAAFGVWKIYVFLPFFIFMYVVYLIYDYTIFKGVKPNDVILFFCNVPCIKNYIWYQFNVHTRFAGPMLWLFLLFVRKVLKNKSNLKIILQNGKVPLLWTTRWMRLTFMIIRCSFLHILSSLHNSWNNQPAKGQNIYSENIKKRFSSSIKTDVTS